MSIVTIIPANTGGIVLMYKFHSNLQNVAKKALRRGLGEVWEGEVGGALVLCLAPINVGWEVNQVPHKAIARLSARTGVYRVLLRAYPMIYANLPARNRASARGSSQRFPCIGVLKLFNKITLFFLLQARRILQESKVMRRW